MTDTTTDPTPEELAAATAYWSSREGQSDRLATRAKRLHRLIKLKAPEIVIEQARRLVFQSLIAFPVDNEAGRDADRIDTAIQARQTEFLGKHGYYDDVIGGHHAG